jgi:DnaJ-domain-containing protein 1
MFSKGDPANQLKRFRVTLKMREGECEACTILAPAHHPLRQSLNDDGPFVEIETEEAGQAFVLKAEIARIDLHEAPEPRPADGDSWNYGKNYSRFEASDARLVLGVSEQATTEELHTKWRELAKAYHPDRLAALGLQDEMLRHADRVLARINAAYQRLKNET